MVPAASKKQQNTTHFEDNVFLPVKTFYFLATTAEVDTCLYSYLREPQRGGAASSPLLRFWLSQPGRLARGVRSCEQFPKILRGAGGRRGETARQEDSSRSMRPTWRTTTELRVYRVSLAVCFSPSSRSCLITHTDSPALQSKKMPKSPLCVFPWSFLWMASLATLVVQSVLCSSYSSSSSSSTYQRSAAGGKRPGFMQRTLILLDVNTRSPIRVLNDNFLSLQLDPSIIKDGWLDFLRQQTVLLLVSNVDLFLRPLLKWMTVLLYITHAATLSKLFWCEPESWICTHGTEWPVDPHY